MNPSLSINELYEYGKQIKISPVLYQEVEAQFATRMLYQTAKDRGVCSHCGTLHYLEPGKYDVKQSAYTCNSCWSTCRMQKVRKNSNFNKNTERRYTRFIVKDGNTFIQLTFDTYMTPEPDGEHFTYWPVEFRFMDGKDIISVHTSYWEWICKGKASLSGGYGYYSPTWIYGYPDFDDLLEDTDLKYSQFGAFMDWTQHKDNESVLEMMVILRKYPMLEMVWKMGLKTIYNEFVRDGSGKRETVKAFRDHRKVVASKNPSMAKLQEAMGMVNKYKTPLDMALDYILERRRIPDYYLEYTHGITDDLKVIKYVFKNDAKDYYYDYLKMMEQVGTPVDKHTIFPKDLAKAHDDVTNKVNTLKYEKDDREYAKRLKTLKTLEITSNGLCIIVPEKMGEILKEGKELHHCVGSYIGDVSKGKTTIIFIRQVNDKETPFYTMEWKNEKIVQIRGDHNKAATPEVKAFTDRWLEWTKKKPKKQKQPVMQLQAVNA